ncbi:MAG: glycosyltransferase [Planctomycetota bacterium]
MSTVTVVIPTLGVRASLGDAIESALQPETHEVLLLLNGSRADPSKVRARYERSRVRVVESTARSLPGAILDGRRAVRSDLFAFLDDDDLLVEGSLTTRADAMRESPEVDVVVMNGWRLEGTERSNAIPSLGRCSADPAMAILHKNWLASSGGLYRANSVDDQAFVDLPAYMEWTALGFRLAKAGKTIRFIDEPGFEIRASPDSLSASLDYSLAQLSGLRDMRRFADRPAEFRRIADKRSRQHHSLAVTFVESGEKRRAWAHHLRSLSHWSGLRFLSFTRRLF